MLEVLSATWGVQVKYCFRVPSSPSLSRGGVSWLGSDPHPLPAPWLNCSLFAPHSKMFMSGFFWGGGDVDLSSCPPSLPSGAALHGACRTIPTRSHGRCGVGTASSGARIGVCSPFGDAGRGWGVEVLRAQHVKSCRERERRGRGRAGKSCSLSMSALRLLSLSSEFSFKLSSRGWRGLCRGTVQN